VVSYQVKVIADEKRKVGAHDNMSQGDIFPDVTRLGKLETTASDSYAIPPRAPCGEFDLIP
jgi:hypothetical protein